MGKIVQYILAAVILITISVGVFFLLVYVGDNFLEPPVVVEESVESLGIENLILEIEDIDNQIKSLESQQAALGQQITQLRSTRSETVAKLNKLLDQIREISGTRYAQ